MRNHTTARVGQRVVALMTATAMAATGVVMASGSLAGAASSASTCAAPTTATSAQLNATTGITKNSVTVGNVSIISGPVPGLFQGAAYGVEAYFNYINSQGGVNGRKLYVKSFDDAFSGTQNQSETAQAVSSLFATVGSFSLFDNYGCNILAQHPAFPDVSNTLDPGTSSLPNVFSAQPLEQGAPQAGYSYLKKKYPKAIKHVANLVSNVETAISQWEGQKAALENLGYSFSYVREVSPVETNFTTDVINMKNAGVQMVLMTDGDWQIFSALDKAMAQQNFHPQVVMSAGPVYSSQFIPAAGGAVNADGIWIIQGQSLYLGEDAKKIPAVVTFNKWIQKVHPGYKPDLFTLFGWANAQLFTQALKKAGKNPTRGSVLTALKGITSFTASGLIAPANPAKKIPPNCVLFAQIKNGKFVRVAPTASGGWDCKSVYYSIDGPLPKVNP